MNERAVWAGAKLNDTSYRQLPIFQADNTVDLPCITNDITKDCAD